MKTAAIGLAGLIIILALVAPAFFAPSNLGDLLVNHSGTLLVALGVTLVILAGQIDISVGSQFAVASVLAGKLAQLGLPVPVLLLATPLLGALLGAANGFLVSTCRIPAIVVTLAMMALLRDSLRWATGGAWVQNLPANFQWFGLTQLNGQILVVILAAVIFVLTALALRHASGARAIYATGSNAEAARLAGWNPTTIVFATFVLAGMFTALGACLNAIRFTEIPSNSGLGLEMKAIAAAVVGGCSITGGRGTAFGTLLGVILLSTIGTALTFLHIDASWEKAIQGAIILIAVLSAARTRGGNRARL